MAQNLDEICDDDEEEPENESNDPSDVAGSADYLQVLPEQEQEAEAEESDQVDIVVAQEDEPMVESDHESDEEMVEVPVDVNSPDNKSPGRRSARRTNSL